MGWGRGEKGKNLTAKKVRFLFCLAEFRIRIEGGDISLFVIFFVIGELLRMKMFAKVGVVVIIIDCIYHGMGKFLSKETKALVTGDIMIVENYKSIGLFIFLSSSVEIWV